MSFRKFNVEPTRSIKIDGKTWRTAHTAAEEYASKISWQFTQHYHSDKRGPDWGVIQTEFYDKAFRRSKKIFTRYFKGT